MVDRIPLPHHRSPASHHLMGDFRLPARTPLSVSLLLKPANFGAFQASLAQGEVMGRSAFLRRHAPTAATRQMVEDWARAMDLRLVETGTEGFIFRLSAGIGNWEKVLGTTFRGRQIGLHTLVFPEADPLLPTPLAGQVTALVGLDNLGRLRPAFRRPRFTDLLANSGAGLFPQDILRVYGVPGGLTGQGSRIGILEFSNGYALSDCQEFWSTHGISRNPATFISVDGGTNDGGATADDMEATLDVEWAGAIAPGADLLVFEAPAGTTDQSFAQNLLSAFHEAVLSPTSLDAISISYGDGENSFPRATVEAWEQVAQSAALIGTTVLVASGDQGAYGLHTSSSLAVAHADTPADLPHITAVGGTRLELDSQGNRLKEAAWTDLDNNGASGGGISQIFPVPGYQSGVALPQPASGHVGRALPDVALNADPDTGYHIIFQGQSQTVGGTSVAAPVWAAFVALMNESRRKDGLGSIGFLNPALYRAQGEGFLDITQGNNSYLGVKGYDAGPGWDAVTGWGVPDVARLLALLGQPVQG